MLETIFTQGWEFNVLMYGIVYWLGRTAAYTIIYRAVIGQPNSYRYEDQKHWYRNATLLGAVIFAPVYEEIMFTYLAYESFLGYAQPGREGLVMIFVAAFFALLHLPGDLRRIGYYLSGRSLYYLFRGQLNRFFYSLAAYFIYQLTGYLWVTITLHYFYNAVVSFHNFDLEDRSGDVEKDLSVLVLIMLINVGFALFVNYWFFQRDADLALWILPLTGFMAVDFVRTFWRT